MKHANPSRSQPVKTQTHLLQSPAIRALSASALVLMAAFSIPMSGARAASTPAPDPFVAYTNAFQAGDYATAHNTGVAALGKKPEDKANLLWQMLAGSAAQMAGKPDDALKLYTSAENAFRAIDASDEKLGGKIANAGRGIASLVGGGLTHGDLALAYKGKVYERIMLGARLGLVRLTKGDIAGANVEFNRMTEWQDQAIERFKDERGKAEKEKEKAEQAKTQAQEKPQDDATAKKPSVWRKIGKGIGEATKAVGQGVGEALSKDSLLNTFSFGEYETQINSLLGTGPNSTFKPYEGDFQNPYATWAAGLVALLMDDPEKGSGILRAAAALVPDNTCATTDAKNAREIWEAMAGNQTSLADSLKAKNLNNRVWVIIENGLCPELVPVQTTLSFAITTNYEQMAKDKKVKPQTTNVTAPAAFPKLVERPAPQNAFYVEAAGQRKQCEIICDMDRVSRAEYNKRLRGVAFRETSRAQGRAQSKYDASKLGRAYNESDVMADVDTRQWATLPKNIHITSLPIPADRKLTIGCSTGTVNVTIPACDNAIVYYCVPTTPAKAPPPAVIPFAKGKK